MSEQDIENIDSLNDEGGEQDTSDDGTPTIEDYNALEEKVSKLEAEKQELADKNRKLYARAKGSRDFTNKSDDSGFEEKLTKLELKTEGYSEEEVEFITQYGGKKALENPIVKTALEVMREKAKAERAVVDSSEDVGNIERKYTDKQLKAMSPDELEALIRSSS